MAIQVCASHNDTRRNGHETGVDCGGPSSRGYGARSPRCPDGEGCGTGADCTVGSTCVLGRCASVTNGVKDGSESGVDCGGGEGVPVGLQIVAPATFKNHMRIFFRKDAQENLTKVEKYF